MLSGGDRGTNGTNVEDNLPSSPQQYPHEDHSGDNSTTTISVQLNTDMTAAQRFPAWLMLMVSSIICIIALQSRRGLFDVDGPGEAWVLSVGCISFVFSLAAVVMYLCFRTVFVGNIPEAVMVRVIASTAVRLDHVGLDHVG
jgi:hypothetical protein